MSEREPWAARRSETEHRYTLARTFYEFEMKCREQDWGSRTFVYDEEHDPFRFKAGNFAFSREHGN